MGKSVLRQKAGQYKGPETGKCLPFWSKSEEASVSMRKSNWRPDGVGSSESL